MSIKNKPAKAEIQKTDDTAVTRSFDTIEGVVNDPIFIVFVQNNVNEIINNRNNRAEPGPGLRYKRDWYDRMRDASMFHTNFFLQNIESIWLKKSTLPSETRGIIKFICTKAYTEMIEHYSKNPIVEPVMEKK